MFGHDEDSSSTRTGDNSLTLQNGGESWKVGWDTEAQRARTPGTSSTITVSSFVGCGEERWCWVL